jgi:hypothetical protein
MKQRRRSPSRRSPISAPIRARRTGPSTGIVPSQRAKLPPQPDPRNYQPFVPRSSTEIGPDECEAHRRTYGEVLRGIAVECYGQAMPVQLADLRSYFRNGGRLVAVGDYDGRYDWLMPDGKPGEPLKVGGICIGVRSEAMDAAAREDQRRAAAEPLKLQQHKVVNGDLPGVTLDARHPSALRGNSIKREYERLRVPSDGPKLSEDD